MPTKMIVVAMRPCVPPGATVCRTAVNVTLAGRLKAPEDGIDREEHGNRRHREPCSTGANRNAPLPSAAADTSTAPRPKRLGGRAAGSEPSRVALRFSATSPSSSSSTVQRSTNSSMPTGCRPMAAHHVGAIQVTAVKWLKLRPARVWRQAC